MSEMFTMTPNPDAYRVEHERSGGGKGALAALYIVNVLPHGGDGATLAEYRGDSALNRILRLARDEERSDPHSDKLPSDHAIILAALRDCDIEPDEEDEAEALDDAIALRDEAAARVEALTGPEGDGTPIFAASLQASYDRDVSAHDVLSAAIAYAAQLEATNAELLAALRKLLGHAEMLNSVAQRPGGPNPDKIGHNPYAIPAFIAARAAIAKAEGDRPKPAFLTYRTQTGATMRAKVITRHANGDATVEPFFWQDAEGRDTGCFQGGHEVFVPASHIIAKAEG